MTKLRNAINDAIANGTEVETFEQLITRYAQGGQQSTAGPASYATTTTATSTTVPPTNSSRSIRQNNAAQVKLSKTTSTWKSLGLPDGKVIESEDAYEIVFSNFAEENNTLLQEYQSLIEELKSKIGCTQPLKLLFVFFVHRIVDTILYNSTQLKTSGHELCTAFALLFLLNGFGYSNGFAMDTFVEKAVRNVPITFERASEILHDIDICDRKKDNITGDASSWGRRDEMQRLFRPVSEALNEKLVRMCTRLVLTLDDDIENSTSQSLMEGEANPVCILRKDGWGVCWDTVSALLDYIPRWVHLRESGGGVMKNFINTFQFKGGEFLFFDRFYTALEWTIELGKRRIGSLGILKSNVTKDTPMDIEILKHFDTPSTYDVSEQRKSQGIVKVQSFPGIGPSVFVSQNLENPNVLAIVAVVRTNSDQDGVIRFLGSIPLGPHKDILSLENIASFTRIPMPVNPNKKKTMLTVAANEGDDKAAYVLGVLEAGCDIWTVTQQDGAWGNSRRLSFTASQAQSSISKILKHSPATAYKRVRAALYVNDGPHSNPLPSDESDGQNEPLPMFGAGEAVTGVRHDEPTSLTEDDPDELPGDEYEERLQLLASEGPAPGEGSSETAAESDVIIPEVVANDELPETASNDEPPASETSDWMDEAIKENWENLGKTFLRHKATPHMVLGNKTEEFIRTFASTLDCVAGNKIYTTGFIRRRGMHYFGCSPDGVFRLTSGEGALLECKTKTMAFRMTSQAKMLVRVQAGTDEFKSHVPPEWRHQLLHQAAVTGFRFVLLCMAAPDGAISSTLVEYDEATLEEYRSLAEHRTIRDLFSWFYDYALADVRDNSVIASIPPSCPQFVRRVVRSHVRLLRAIYKYRTGMETPIPPTKCFRPTIINTYNIGKTGVDGFCKDIAGAMKNMTFNFNWRQLAPIRYVYMALVTSLKVGYQCEFLKEKGENVPKKVPQYRAELRKYMGKMVDCIGNFALELLERPIDISSAAIWSGSQRVAGQPLTQSETPAPKTIEVSEVLGAFPEYLFAAVKSDRQNRFGRTRPVPGDFWDGLPIEGSYMSMTSPQPMVHEKYLGRISDSVLHGAVKISRAEFKNQKNEKKWEFWNSKTGRILRGCAMIMHSPIERTRGPKCFKCDASPNRPILCSFCGVTVCPDCLEEFHKPYLDPESCSELSSANTSSTQVHSDVEIGSRLSPIPFPNLNGSQDKRVRLGN